MYLRLELGGFYLELGAQAPDEVGDAEEAAESAVPVATSAPDVLFAEHDFEHTVPRGMGFFQ